MTFPWKKVKITKFPQLVNDHLNKSQKRRDGSSLVVQTGFPTSLIDLFIKNQEKLKRSPKKKRASLSPIEVNQHPVIAVSPSPKPSHSLVIAESPTPRVIHSPLCSPSPLNEIVHVVENEKEHCVDANGVLFAVLKMFLVVVLALGMKKLTVGITLSAFLLFFLDCVGKRVSKLSKPCSDAKRVLRSVVEKIWRLLRVKGDKLDEKNEQNSCSSSMKSSESRCPIQEIQIMEPKCYWASRVEEILPEIELMYNSSIKRRLAYEEVESKEGVVEKKESNICEVGELKKRKSRKDKIKSKMTKFVPKKLKSSKKEHHPEIVREDNLALSEEQEVCRCEDEGDYSETSSGSSSISSRRYQEEDSMDSICAFGGLSKVNEEAVMNREEEGSGLNWSHLVLCSIVLIGLIGGRGFAVVLTLSCCLVLNWMKHYQGYVNWSCDDKSG